MCVCVCVCVCVGGGGSFDDTEIEDSLDFCLSKLGARNCFTRLQAGKLGQSEATSVTGAASVVYWLESVQVQVAFTCTESGSRRPRHSVDRRLATSHRAK